jgi:hypothetical protein
VRHLEAAAKLRADLLTQYGQQRREVPIAA